GRHLVVGLQHFQRDRTAYQYQARDRAGDREADDADADEIVGDHLLGYLSRAARHRDGGSSVPPCSPADGRSPEGVRGFPPPPNSRDPPPSAPGPTDWPVTHVIERSAAVGIGFGCPGRSVPDAAHADDGPRMWGDRLLLALEIGQRGLETSPVRSVDLRQDARQGEDLRRRRRNDSVHRGGEVRATRVDAGPRAPELQRRDAV